MAIRRTGSLPRTSPPHAAKHGFDVHCVVDEAQNYGGGVADTAYVTKAGTLRGAGAADFHFSTIGFPAWLRLASSVRKTTNAGSGDFISTVVSGTLIRGAPGPPAIQTLIAMLKALSPEEVKHDPMITASHLYYGWLEVNVLGGKDTRRNRVGVSAAGQKFWDPVKGTGVIADFLNPVTLHSNTDNPDRKAKPVWHESIESVPWTSDCPLETMRGQWILQKNKDVCEKIRKATIEFTQLSTSSSGHMATRSAKSRFKLLREKMQRIAMLTKRLQKLEVDGPNGWFLDTEALKTELRRLNRCVENARADLEGNPITAETLMRNIRKNWPELWDKPKDKPKTAAQLKAYEDNEKLANMRLLVYLGQLNQKIVDEEEARTAQLTELGLDADGKDWKSSRIVQWAVTYCVANSPRDGSMPPITVLSDFKTTLTMVKRGLEESGLRVAVCFGGKSEADRYTANDCDVLLGNTEAMGAGGNFPGCNVVALGCPFGSEQKKHQCMGRFRRGDHGNTFYHVPSDEVRSVPLVKSLVDGTDIFTNLTTVKMENETITSYRALKNLTNRLTFNPEDGAASLMGERGEEVAADLYTLSLYDGTRSRELLETDGKEAKEGKDSKTKGSPVKRTPKRERDDDAEDSEEGSVRVKEGDYMDLDQMAPSLTDIGSAKRKVTINHFPIIP